jgi:hypothetical protein
VIHFHRTLRVVLRDLATEVRCRVAVKDGCHRRATGELIQNGVTAESRAQDPYDKYAEEEPSVPPSSRTTPTTHTLVAGGHDDDRSGHLEGVCVSGKTIQVSEASQPIDDAVRRLVGAYREAGLAAIGPATPGIEQVLVEIKREIAPLLLPEELVRFWQLVDPATISVAPYPRPTTAEFALDSWMSHRDEFPGMTPRLLFPVAYESHGFLFAELDDGQGEPGAVLDWGYGGSPFYVQFAALSGYVDLLATMIELGEFQRHETDTHSWVQFDPEGRWDDARAVRLAAAQPLPRLGASREIDEDVRQWPEHWLASNGLTSDMRSPRGATTTVAELLRGAAIGTEVSGTIHATVTSLAGSGAGSRISVDDGTGVLDVWCPAAVSTYGPVIRRQFEFDVIVRPNPEPPPDWRPEQRDAQQYALVQDLGSAQSAAMGLYAKAFQTSAAAEATAIRPLG